MSHETTASLWSTLSDQDLCACIRDAAGQCLLGLYLHQPGSVARRDILLTYSLELIAIFDFGRSSRHLKASLHNVSEVTIRQEQIYLALISLLASFDFEISAQTNLPTQPSYADFIIGRVLLSAICALKVFAGDQRPREADQLVIAIKEFLSRLPGGREEFSLIKALCQYLIKECSPRPMGGQEKQKRFGMSDEVFLLPESEKSTYVNQLVHQAINPAVPSDQSIKAVIGLCSLYWDTEAVIVRSCVPTDPKTGRDKVEDNQEAINVQTAMELRFVVQECLSFAESEYCTIVGGFRLYRLFTPGLKPVCLQDTCNCDFKQPDSEIIIDLRSKLQSEILRLFISKSYAACPLASWRSKHCETTLAAFERRLRSSPRLHLAEIATTNKSNTPPRADSLPRKGFLDSATSPMSLDSNDPITSQPSNLPSPSPEGFFSRPRLLSGQNSYQAAVIEEGLEPVAKNQISLSLPTLSTSSRASSTRKTPKVDTESDTTTPPGTHSSLEASLESYKIAVEASKLPTSETNWQLESSYPELAFRIDPDSLSLMSDNSMPVTAASTKTTSARRWGNLLKTKRGATPPPFVIPKFRFFSSGKHILLWTKYGCGYLDPHSRHLTPIIVPDVIQVAGGSRRFALVSRPAQGYKVSVYNVDGLQKVREWTMPHCPGAISVSRDDKYLALKYTPLVRLYNLEDGSAVDHKLPVHEGSRSGSGNHMVSFSQDNQSFMASTRFPPEKVYSYWAKCNQPPNNRPSAVQSVAPFGHVDDNGLTNLSCGVTASGHAHGFLSTFTEKGAPVILNMNSSHPNSRQLRDPRELVGTRIHGAAMSVDAGKERFELVMVNDLNDVFWVTDLFGRETDIKRINTLKRPKSLKNDIEVAMSGQDEASIFWVDKNCRAGVLVKIGKQGGKNPPVHFNLDVDPLRCG